MCNSIGPCLPFSPRETRHRNKQAAPDPPAGVSGLRREDADTEEAKTYALLMADTVLVTADVPELLTTAAARSWKDNAYFFKVTAPVSFIQRVPLVAFDCLGVRT